MDKRFDRMHYIMRLYRVCDRIQRHLILGSHIGDVELLAAHHYSRVLA